MPRIPAKSIRNHAVIEALKRGESRRSVARRFFISVARVEQIWRHGAIVEVRRHRQKIAHPTAAEAEQDISERAGFWLANRARFRYQAESRAS